MRKTPTIETFIFLSLILHLAFGAGLKTLPTSRFWTAHLTMPPVLPLNAWVEIQELSDSDQDHDKKYGQRLIRKLNLPPELLEKSDLENLENKDKRIQIASEDEQRVIKEQQAHARGPNHNAIHPSIPTKPTPDFSSHISSTMPHAESIKDSKYENENENENKNEKGLIPLAQVDTGDIPSSQTQPLFINASSADVSTLEETFDDVVFGSITALNTDRLTYYSYYSRIEDSVRPFWKNYVDQIVAEYERHPGATGDEIWKTFAEIILDKEGRFIKAIIRKQSGFDKLDLGPAYSFREAQQIPHPPSGMIQNDGHIHIAYEFIVKVQIEKFKSRSSSRPTP